MNPPAPTPPRDVLVQKLNALIDICCKTPNWSNGISSLRNEIIDLFSTPSSVSGSNVRFVGPLEAAHISPIPFDEELHLLLQSLKIAQTPEQKSEIVAAVISRLRSNEQQKADDRECDEYLIERLGGLLAKIALTVNGPFPGMGVWSYHDLPEKVEALKKQADRIERALAVQGEVDVRVFRICEHCHQEYMLTFGPTGISNFGPCPNCKRRDDPWIRVARTQEPR